MPVPATRDLIVETADSLFYEGGFEATSFAHIAERLGISRGNFYHHFKTKDDILDAVITRRIADTRAMLDAWQDAGGGPRGRILCFVRMLIANRTKIMAWLSRRDAVRRTGQTRPRRSIAPPRYSVCSATGSPGNSAPWKRVMLRGSRRCTFCAGRKASPSSPLRFATRR